MVKTETNPVITIINIDTDTQSASTSTITPTEKAKPAVTSHRNTNPYYDSTTCTNVKYYTTPNINTMITDLYHVHIVSITSTSTSTRKTNQNNACQRYLTSSRRLTTSFSPFSLYMPFFSTPARQDRLPLHPSCIACHNNDRPETSSFLFVCSRSSPLLPDTTYPSSTVRRRTVMIIAACS